MHTKFTSLLRHQSVQILVLAVLCVAGSFSVGIKTAGDVQPFTLIEAGSGVHPGDIDASGVIDVRDAIAILEVAQGYRTATTDELQADPNEDGQLTVEDAIRILTDMAY